MLHLVEEFTHKVYAVTQFRIRLEPLYMFHVQRSHYDPQSKLPCVIQLPEVSCEHEQVHLSLQLSQLMSTVPC